MIRSDNNDYYRVIQRMEELADKLRRFKISKRKLEEITYKYTQCDMRTYNR